MVRTNWTNAVSERHELLPELVDPARLALLKGVFSDPDRLRPGRTREALTGQAAGEFAELAGRLRAHSAARRPWPPTRRQLARRPDGKRDARAS